MEVLGSFEMMQLIFISCESSLKFRALESEYSQKPVSWLSSPGSGRI